MLQSRTTAAFDARQSHPAEASRLLARSEPSAVLRARFLAELAYYEADKGYLSVDKCAARCRWLSMLLTAAMAVDSSDGSTLR